MPHTPPLIVIADSDVQYLQLMQELLIEEGYQVTIADGGPSAYQVIRDKQADMAILDISIMHPDAPLVTLTMLRLDPTTKHIPALICSTNTHLIRDSSAHLQEMGCRILEKPFYLDAMLEEISILLGINSRAVGQPVTTQTTRGL